MFHLTTMNQPLTTAQIINQKYASNASVFVSPEQRINDYFASVPGSYTELQEVIQIFKLRTPNLNSSNIQLPIAHMVSLDRILIDDTMNRPLEWEHLKKIVKNFDPILVDGVRVYEDSTMKGKLIAWDGQHTTLALYIIFCLIWGVNPKDVIIPVIINRSSHKSDIRRGFIGHNSSTKKGGIKLELSPLNLYSQEVFGVRIDLSTDPKWIESERKQSYLEKANLYLIDKKNHNSLVDEGAITRPTDITNQDPYIVEQFTRYWIQRTAVKGNSIVEPKEIVIIYELLNGFKNNNVELTDVDFANMVALFNRSFKIDFRARAVIYERLDDSFNNWFKTNYKHPKNWLDLTEDQKLKYPSRPDKFTVSNPVQEIHMAQYLKALMDKFQSTFPVSGQPKINISYTPNLKDVY